MYLTAIWVSDFCRPGDVSIEFPNGREKGWHVIIGDNASGKSSLLKAAALALINQPDFSSLRIAPSSFVLKGKERSYSYVLGKPDLSFDEITTDTELSELKDLLGGIVLYMSEDITFSPPIFVRFNDGQGDIYPVLISRFHDEQLLHLFDGSKIHPQEIQRNTLRYCNGWFSASYGPFRRLTGGNPQWQDLSNVAPRAAAHITLFDESAALTDVLDWLKDLDRRQFKELARQQPGDPEPESARIFNGVRHFINHSELLPGGVQFIEVNLDGVPVFRDANGHDVTVAQLSDGFRSILSVAFDLVRQLIRVYGLDKVFPPGQSDITSFPLPGVVLIDEVDAHLHPTWQTRIGQWFTKHFPEMQFIVTTHSPLICRACEHGTIWRLSPPGSKGGIEQITGAEKDRLVYGNVLDAYETQAFGAQMSRGEEGRHAQKEYLDLYYKRLYDVPMNEKEKARLEQLEAVFHSHVAIDED